MIGSLLDNPTVLNALLGALALVLGWGFRKVLVLVDSKWATEHLTGVGLHAGHAAETAFRVYADGIKSATDPGSDQGQVVTDDERGAARQAARDRFVEEIGLGQLRKALGISRGQKVGDAAAKSFATELVDAALDRAAPFVKDSTA